MSIDDFKRLYRIKVDYWFLDLIREFAGTVFIAGGSVRDWVTTASPLIGGDGFRYYEDDEFTIWFGPRPSDGWSWAEHEAVNGNLGDIDCFFPSEDDLNEFGRLLESSGFVKAKSSNERVDNYIYAIDTDALLVFQLIKMRWYSSLSEVIDSFDLSPCMIGIDKNNVVFGRWTPRSIRRKRVRIHRITYPLSTLRRLIKYGKYGFYSCDGTLRDAAIALTEAIERDDPNVEFRYVD